MDVRAALGEADNRDDPLRSRGEPLDRLEGVTQEVLLVEQVLGRVAGDGELAAQRESGAGGPRSVDRVGDRRPSG